MQCKRLIVLIKDWYIHVQDEAMAPARMVEFMTKHISTCPECQQDPDVKEEAEKIREIVLPPSKIPKVRATVNSPPSETVKAEESDNTEDNANEDKNTDQPTDSD